MNLKEIAVISGKGGTGKSSFTASLLPFLPECVIADCDVDAPDLHILLNPEPKEQKSFYGGVKAVQDVDRCMGCGKCSELCRFSAISPGPVFNGMRCEGCGLCAEICPASAVEMMPARAGELFESRTGYGPLVHARLEPGEENSGKLVAAVRERAREAAARSGAGLVLVDGSPGVGCSVIASITGADLVLIVTEPTLSGLHDLERVIDLTDQMGLPAAVVLNKSDLSRNIAKKVRAFCRKRETPLLVEIPFSENWVAALAQKRIPSVADPGFFERIGMDGVLRLLNQD